SGSDAISPHTLAGLPAARAASATSLRSRSTLGSCGVKRSASRALPRSTTSVYWVRSLVPTLRKSLISASRSARTAAAGVSTITPSGTDLPMGIPTLSRRAASSCIISRVRSTSSSRVTKGIMRWRLVVAAARKTAVARNQEFGPEQPHAFRSVRLSRFDLVGQIHVAAQRDVHAVERDGWLSNGFLETRSQLAAPCVGALGLLDLGRGWIEQYGS